MIIIFHGIKKYFFTKYSHKTQKPRNFSRIWPKPTLKASFKVNWNSENHNMCMPQGKELYFAQIANVKENFNFFENMESFKNKKNYFDRYLLFFIVLGQRAVCFCV